MNFKNALLASVFLFISAAAQAQTLESDGVAGDMDNKSRSPHLTVSSSIETNQVVILADAFHASDDFKKYPIQFEFFVNRKLISTQYRSPTLDGPVGLTVPNSIATVPFNYVVVAKMLHPNSVYTTVIEAAVTGDNDNGETGLDCTLTLDDSSIYTANDVLLTQSGDTAGSVSFSATSQDGDSTAQVSANFSGESGTITVTKEGESAEELSGTSTSESNDTTVTSFTITSDDGNSTLSCS